MLQHLCYVITNNSFFIITVRDVSIKFAILFARLFPTFVQCMKRIRFLNNFEKVYIYIIFGVIYIVFFLK